MNKLHYAFQQKKESSNVVQLYIYDDVTEFGRFNWNTFNFEKSETSADFFRQKLSEIPEYSTIELHINSNGGSVKEGVAIYNQLKQSANNVVGIVDGVAYSVAFLILQACDERVMGLGTSALVHEMWIECAGNADELRRMADDLDVLMDSNRKIFAQRSTLSEEEIKQMMKDETFLTPEQCLEYGFIDRILKESETKNTTQQQVEEMQQKNAALGQLIEQRKALQASMQMLQQSTPKPQAQSPMEMKLSDFFN